MALASGEEVVDEEANDEETNDGKLRALLLTRKRRVHIPLALEIADLLIWQPGERDQH